LPKPYKFGIHWPFYYSQPLAFATKKYAETLNFCICGANRAALPVEYVRTPPHFSHTPDIFDNWSPVF
jgi:hypothetical protein